jgi:hypothetical protein
MLNLLICIQFAQPYVCTAQIHDQYQHCSGVNEVKRLNLLICIQFVRPYVCTAQMPPLCVTRPRENRIAFFDHIHSRSMLVVVI